MLSRKELYKTHEYWIERIQNDVFRALNNYKEENDLKNNTALADRLGVSKGYVSQIMNGNFNFSISKLVELSLQIGVAPDLELKALRDFIHEEEVRLDRMANPHSFTLTSLNTGNGISVGQKEENPLKIAG